MNPYSIRRRAEQITAKVVMDTLNLTEAQLKAHLSDKDFAIRFNTMVVDATNKFMESDNAS